MKTITFYSYKGGVGRTLALANVAKYLARFGQNVIAMDFDLEAPGLHYKFAMHHTTETEHAFRGVVDLLSDSVARGKLPDSLEAYVHDVKTKQNVGRIRLLPAGDAPSVDYWKKLAALDWRALFYAEPNPPGVALLEKLCRRIERTFEPDFFLIDARTGISELGGVATTVIPDMVVCLLNYNPESLDGTREVLHRIRTAPRAEGQEAIEILPVVTRIPQHEDLTEEKKILDKVREALYPEVSDLGGACPLETVYMLHSEPSLQVKEALTLDVALTPADSPLLQDYYRLFFRLIPREAIQPYLAELIQEARDMVWTNPDEAQKKLEALVDFSGAPLSHQALIGFYDIFKRESHLIMEAAFRYYDLIKDPADLLLQKVVRSHYKSLCKHKKLLVPMAFIVDVVGASHTQESIFEFSKEIVELLFLRNCEEDGIQFSVETLRRFGHSEGFFRYALKTSIRGGKHENGFEMVERCKDMLKDQEEFREMWARLVLETKDLARVKALYHDATFNFDLFQEQNPDVACKVVDFINLWSETE